MEHDKTLKFENNRNGFNAIFARIYEICKKEDFNKVIVGMEPTGHYWKAFANFLLKQAKITVVLVNPYHTKKKAYYEPELYSEVIEKASYKRLNRFTVPIQVQGKGGHLHQPSEAAIKQKTTLYLYP